MGETGVGAVEAEAVVHIDTVVMRSVHVDLLEERMTEIIAIMIEVGGLEAEVRDVEEVEALVEEEIRVQSGKAVLREGLRLSNGTGKENKQNLLIRMIIFTMTMVTTTFNKMINSIIIHHIKRTSSSSSMEDHTTTNLIETFWFVSLPIL